MNSFLNGSLRVCAFCLVISPVQAEVTHASASGFIIENSQVTSADPQSTWRALVSDVDKWWPKDHSWWQGTFTIDTSAGGCFCERAGDNSAEHMRISLVNSPTTLIMTGGLGPLQGMGVNGALTWKLIPEGSGTRVTLTYKVHGYAPPDGFVDFAPVVDQVQSLQLGGLITYLSKSNDE
ncbi:SRPBCC domain-containing protein [Alteromonas sp. H39]|uniref:SRPBCC domain-containing protein n=1 Tax=Alteromonas sp. H39 TaxID=3389876 RepID=UPI0039E0BB5B